MNTNCSVVINFNSRVSPSNTADDFNYYEKVLSKTCSVVGHMRYKDKAPRIVEAKLGGRFINIDSMLYFSTVLSPLVLIVFLFVGCEASIEKLEIANKTDDRSFSSTSFKARKLQNSDDTSNLIFIDPLKPDDVIKDPIVGDGVLSANSYYNKSSYNNYWFYTLTNNAKLFIGESEDSLQLLHEISAQFSVATRVAFGYGYIHNDRILNTSTLRGIGNELNLPGGQNALFELSMLNEGHENMSIEYFFENIVGLSVNSWAANHRSQPFNKKSLVPFFAYAQFREVPNRILQFNQIKGIMHKGTLTDKTEGTCELPVSGELHFKEIIGPDLPVAMLAEYSISPKSTSTGMAKFLLGIGVREPKREHSSSPVFTHGVYFDGLTIYRQFEDSQEDVVQPIDVSVEYEIKDDYVEMRFQSTLLKTLGHNAIVEKLTYYNDENFVLIFAHLGGLEIKSKREIKKGRNQVTDTWLFVVLFSLLAVVLAFVTLCICRKSKKKAQIHNEAEITSFELGKKQQQDDAATVLESSSYIDV